MKYRMSQITRLGLAIGLAGAAIPAMAHHSFAAYDMRSTKEVDGVLREFRWGAPHSSMVVEYKNEKGETVRMSLASGSPLMFSKQGFKPRDFKRGDKVHVVFHPNANGSPGGALASFRLPDGRTFSDDEAARNTPPGA